MPNREHWLTRLKPLGAQAEIPYRRALTSAEVEALRAGLWPRDMDERWVVYLGDDGLAIHRSWTGNCIYRLPAAGSPDGALVLGPLFVRDDAEIYRRQEDAREIGSVESLIAETVEHVQRSNLGDATPPSA